MRRHTIATFLRFEFLRIGIWQRPFLLTCKLETSVSASDGASQAKGDGDRSLDSKNRLRRSQQKQNLKHAQLVVACVLRLLLCVDNCTYTNLVGLSGHTGLAATNLKPVIIFLKTRFLCSSTASFKSLPSKFSGGGEKPPGDGDRPRIGLPMGDFCSARAISATFEVFGREEGPLWQNLKYS
jgi:hypothetical protein